ncbi:hypothetical protein QRX50_34155 [Amycolatopsis carbonis]|uniref:Uncharacterized protein n=1 Tax=Amycolatopsis carbonis TaxID=715471 RepID=A0A9Y2IAS8_9PSEU|nr:hypothetical protein [Amycolatopsis sp. 2-15]WIX76484.1 hypothetical protein QRX50_34155 [Amycolatopsis sp. 2-15]
MPRGTVVTGSPPRSADRRCAVRAQGPALVAQPADDPVRSRASVDDPCECRRTFDRSSCRIENDAFPEDPGHGVAQILDQREHRRTLLRFEVERGPAQTAPHVDRAGVCHESDAAQHRAAECDRTAVLPVEVVSVALARAQLRRTLEARVHAFPVVGRVPDGSPDPRPVVFSDVTDHEAAGRGSAVDIEQPELQVRPGEGDAQSGNAIAAFIRFERSQQRTEEPGHRIVGHADHECVAAWADLPEHPVPGGSVGGIPDGEQERSLQNPLVQGMRGRNRRVPRSGRAGEVGTDRLVGFLVRLTGEPAAHQGESGD